MKVDHSCQKIQAHENAHDIPETSRQIGAEGHPKGREIYTSDLDYPLLLPDADSAVRYTCLNF